MMPTWGWIVLCIGAFCFGWTLGADWLLARREQKNIEDKGDDYTSNPDVKFVEHRGDYYIDPEKGNDETGNGSKEKPFKTTARLKKEFEK